MVAIALTFSLMARAAFPVRVQGERWLSVEQLSGPVSLIPYQGVARSARVGDRLSAVGDAIVTGSNASARLTVDLQTGFVSMAENSQIQVQTLSITNSGGRVTELRVDRGQVRLRVRPLTNPATRLEIHTPAGVSGVRGTDFGVTVQPDGQTGVATLEGRVDTRAQGQTVTVAADWQTSVYPGEPPQPPETLRDDPTLFIEQMLVLPESAADTPMVRLTGRTDNVNLLKVNGDLKRLSREGYFNLVIPLFEVGANARSGQLSLSATVITPLGTEQAYSLVIP